MSVAPVGPNRIKLCLMCPGLGHISRGYESFTRECFEALSQDDRLEVHLLKGAGPTVGNEKVIPSLIRNQIPARAIAKFWKSNYHVEQLSFSYAALPYLTRLKPDVIFFSDEYLRGALWNWRRLTGQKYRLLMSNGGPVGPPFPRCDHVHQVLPAVAAESIEVGQPADRQSLVPYGFQIARDLTVINPAERLALRQQLQLPVDRPIVLSVGAINSYHKRMDYIIREVASLPTPRPFLQILGNMEGGSKEIVRLGTELLGADGFRVSTVPATVVPSYYQAVDLFALASLFEGFGRVYVEALAAGLPCLVHDYSTARFALGDQGCYGDLSTTGGLASLIQSIDLNEESAALRATRHNYAYQHFSWDQLCDPYVAMIRQCAQHPLPR